MSVHPAGPIGRSLAFPLQPTRGRQLKALPVVGDDRLDPPQSTPLSEHSRQCGFIKTVRSAIEVQIERGIAQIHQAKGAIVGKRIEDNQLGIGNIDETGTPERDGHGQVGYQWPTGSAAMLTPNRSERRAR